MDFVKRWFRDSSGNQNVQERTTSVSVPSPRHKGKAYDLLSTIKKGEEITFDESEIGQHFNFENHVVSYCGIDEPVLYYDWIADSATTSHVCRECEVFTTYKETGKTISIIGVGGTITYTDGIGMIQVKTRHKDKTYSLILNDILHIPAIRTICSP